MYIDTFLSLRGFTYEKIKFIKIKNIRKEVKDHTNKRNLLIFAIFVILLLLPSTLICVLGKGLLLFF